MLNSYEEYYLEGILRPISASIKLEYLRELAFTISTNFRLRYCEEPKMQDIGGYNAEQLAKHYLLVKAVSYLTKREKELLWTALAIWINNEQTNLQ